MLIKGITDYSKACILIALKQLFDAHPYYGTVDWGEDFLVDYFTEYERCGGFMSANNYLIEESAPLVRFQHGRYTFHYTQTDYFKAYDRNENIRYRLPGNRNVVLIFVTNADLKEAHAVCIPASEVVTYLKKYDFVTLFLPKYGLIIDNRTYEQDFPDEA